MFRDAREVLQWLAQEYPNLGPASDADTARQQAHFREHEDRWHPLLRDAAPQPKFVLHDQSTVPELRRQTFTRKRLESSVRRAFAGRDDLAHQAHYVAQWVLWSLAGQEVVRSADLTSIATQCIRRVDQIAYLRWVLVVKDLDERELRTEALGLIRSPSPRLRFDVEAAADPRRTDQIHPLRETVGAQIAVQIHPLRETVGAQIAAQSSDRDSAP